MRWRIRVIFTLILFAAWLTLGYVYVNHSLGSPQRSETVQLEINQGASIFDIGRQLKELSLIRNDWLFSTYSYITGKSKGLQAGVYEVPPNMDVDGILDMVTQGRQNTYMVTIPEGYTIQQIAQTIAKHGKISEEEFLEAVETGNYNYDYLKEIPTDKEKRHYRLEGYLFPSTYNIPKNADGKYVVNMMLGQFEQRLKKKGGLAGLKQRDISLDTWVIIASIVEREGQAKGEFPKISGVIHNRLDQDMRLQVDATIQYAMGKPKARLLYKDLKLESAYNTYTHGGLPPGPISNPGDTALDAAFSPEKHEYLYYVTKKDGSKEHYFAETFEEHKNYIKKSKQTQMDQSGN